MSDHIIHRQRIILATGFEALSQTVANEVSNVCKSDLPNLLQTVFDELAAEDEIVRINSLHIDVGTIPAEEIKTLFAEKVTEKIREAIAIRKEKRNDKNDVEIIHKKQSLHEALLSFLQTGTLPWFFNANKKESFEMQMQKRFSEPDWQKIKDWIKQNYARQPVLVERLIYQFSDDLLNKIISSLSFTELNNWKAIYKNWKDEFRAVSNKKENEVRNEIWLNSFHQFLHPSQKENVIERTIDDTKNEVKRKPFVDNKSNEAQYVSNCGIVLLHPFLEMYFDELSLLQKAQFINDESCKRAVLLLHYLATGETKLEEWNAVLQKALCGLALEETLLNTIELTDKEKEESNQLLRSVINYWTPLKNTSVEGLQSSFLQRAGKLEQKENGWLLTIEQKTIDVLLNKLPWGFSTIKLPWMNELISVDWC